jgi:zinc/manganese transport system substrate-binding protein
MVRMISNKAAAALLLVTSVFTGTAQAKLDVFACEPEWRSLATELGGGRLRAESATTAFQDPHHIEARPSLIVKARRADVLFCTGAELEIGWLPLLLKRSGNRQIKPGKPGYMMAAEHVRTIEVPKNVDRSQGHVHAAGNPHVHLDPRRLLTIAELFTDRLIQLEPDKDFYWRAQLSSFSTRWQVAIKDWEARAKPLRGSKVMVYHKNWSYLLEWLGIEAVADLEPKPGIPPSSGHLANLVQVAKSEKPVAILVANYQDRKGADWLSKKTGVPVIELPFTVGGAKGVDDLFSLYERLIQSLSQR